MTYLGSRADFFGNYPPGAANDPRAPYNQKDPPEQTFSVKAEYGISRYADVTTTEYDDIEMLQAEDDYEDEYMSPLEIFDFARQCAEYLLTVHNFKLGSKTHLKKVLESCKDWQVDNKEIYQDLP